MATLSRSGAGAGRGPRGAWACGPASRSSSSATTGARLYFGDAGGGDAAGLPGAGLSRNAAGGAAALRRAAARRASPSPRIRSRSTSSWSCAQRTGAPAHIVYDDPRGVATYAAPGLCQRTMPWRRAARRGSTAMPGLAAALMPARAAGRRRRAAPLLRHDRTSPRACLLKHRHLIAAVRQGRGRRVTSAAARSMWPICPWRGSATSSSRWPPPSPALHAQHSRAAGNRAARPPRDRAHPLFRLGAQLGQSADAPAGANRGIDAAQAAAVRHFMTLAVDMERRRLAGETPRCRTPRAAKRWAKRLVYGPIKDHWA